MRYRRVTVFGASGFIGRYVVKRLAARGCVIAAGCRSVDGAKFLRPMGDVGQIAPIRARVTEEAEVAAAVAGMDVVVNLAGILHESGGQAFDEIHQQGAARLARLARAAGVRRLVHISAIGADPGGGSAYARSKGQGEAALRAAFPDAVILRPSVVFGPEDQFFNRFARMALLCPALPLIGGGRTKFQPVYVGDVADAVIRSLDMESADGRTYELGGPRVYAFRELMELVLRETGRKRALVDLPFGLASFFARFAELLPDPPLTRDQVAMLRQDNVVAPGAPGFAELGIVPTGPEAIIPTYMDVYRRGGWFATQRMERWF
jgi:NADH dehydrogenase